MWWMQRYLNTNRPGHAHAHAHFGCGWYFKLNYNAQIDKFEKRKIGSGSGDWGRAAGTQQSPTAAVIIMIIITTTIMMVKFNYLLLGGRKVETMQSKLDTQTEMETGAAAAAPPSSACPQLPEV